MADKRTDDPKTPANLPTSGDPGDDRPAGIETAPPEVLQALERAGVDLNDPRIVQAVQLLVEYSAGPYPPPSMMEAYKEIDPAICREIIESARSQREHRQSLERLATEGGIARMNRAQRNGFVVAMLGLIIAAAVGALAAYLQFSPLVWLAVAMVVVAVGGPPAARVLAKVISAKQE